MQTEKLIVSRLVKKVATYYKSNCHKLNKKYHWKVNIDNLPFSNFKLDGSNLLEINLSLKKVLNRKFIKSSSKADRIAITKYYIYYWGGIHSNAKSKIEFYATEDVHKIIELGNKGIASWSKALTVRNSKKYAIFDARVSVSLNGIIYNEFGKKGMYFPLLTTRNETIRKFHKDFRREIGIENYLPSGTFYELYLNIIHAVAKECNTSISEIEMCLFAFAEEVALNTFKK